MASERSDTGTALVETVRRAEAEALVQRLLAPFVAELGAVREELGRERALREAAERERDELRARLSTVVDTPPTPPAATGAAAGAHRGADIPRRPAGLWARLRRALGGWGGS